MVDLVTNHNLTVFAMLILMSVISFIVWLYELYLRTLPSALKDLSVAPCKSIDLPFVFEIARAQIGSATIDLEQIQGLYSHNKKSIWKVTNTKSHKIVGYFCVLPLTRAGEARVLERDLLLGSLDISNFAMRFGKGSSVYIGGIAGENLKASAAAIEQLKAFLLSVDAVKAYARPVTDSGVRLVQQYGFKPISSHDKVEQNTYVYRIRSI